MNSLLSDPPRLSGGGNSNKNSISGSTIGALPFNKMFIMLPVMLGARKISNDDEQMVFMIRLAYGIIQTICFVIVAYSYIVISSLPTSKQYTSMNRIVYIPAPAQPFADPNTTKRKFTEIHLLAHALTSIRSLLGSTLFGIVFTCGLHYYKGMIMGLAIQSVMGFINLWDNVLVRVLLLRGPSVFNDPTIRIFDEKISMDELDTLTDEVVDDKGNPIVIRNTIPSSNGKVSTTLATTSKTLEEVMLDTWDKGAGADLTELLSMLNTDTINTQTTDDKWTSLMIVSGLKCDGDVAAIRTMISEYKADILMTDNDGWTCLHWAAFHNSLSAVTELYHHTALLSIQDSEQKTPLDLAIAENNTGIIDLLQTVMKDTKKDK